jgi:hypothetical protein
MVRGRVGHEHISPHVEVLLEQSGWYSAGEEITSVPGARDGGRIDHIWVRILDSVRSKHFAASGMPEANSHGRCLQEDVVIIPR